MMNFNFKKTLGAVLVAATITSVAAASSTDSVLSEIVEIIHFEGKNNEKSYHLHKVIYIDGLTDEWKETNIQMSEEMKRLPICSDAPPIPTKTSPIGACRPDLANGQTLHEEHHFFGNGLDFHTITISGNGWSKTHTWGTADSTGEKNEDPSSVSVFGLKSEHE